MHEILRFCVPSQTFVKNNFFYLITVQFFENLEAKCNNITQKHLIMCLRVKIWCQCPPHYSPFSETRSKLPCSGVHVFFYSLIHAVLLCPIRQKTGAEPSLPKEWQNLMRPSVDFDYLTKAFLWLVTGQGKLCFWGTRLDLPEKGIIE
jgi:hypothetical protein